MMTYCNPFIVKATTVACLIILALDLSDTGSWSKSGKNGDNMTYRSQRHDRVVVAATFTFSHHHNNNHEKNRLTTHDGGKIQKKPLVYRYRAPSNSRDANASNNWNDISSESQEIPNGRTTSPSNTSSRRELLQQTQQQISAALLTSLILGNNPVNAQQERLKTIVITGANSGIGFEACKRLVTHGHTIILACRTINKAQDAIERIMNDETVIKNGILLPAECNLADMTSIQQFVQTLSTTMKTNNNNNYIDTLCLNAGVSRNTAATDCERTKDGFELTVGVNHFGHFYLNHLMSPLLANDGRIVVTASSVHDPESPGGAQGVPATLGELQGLQQLGKECEMLDGNPFNADKAYKDSKLCNVLFTRELQRRLEKDATTKNVIVNCFSPGLIVGTGLFRDQNPFFVKLFDVAATNLLKVGETPEWGGASLDYMTTITTKGLFYNSAPGSSKYGEDAFGREFVPMEVSKEGRDDAKAKLLWDLSEKVLGINTNS